MTKKGAYNNSNIIINTTKINIAIDTLSALNKGMDTDFNEISNVVGKLGSSWSGRASGKAISQFNKLKTNYNGSGGRKAVMNQYINFLKSNVMADYESTEKINTDFASLFK